MFKLNLIPTRLAPIKTTDGATISFSNSWTTHTNKINSKKNIIIPTIKEKTKQPQQKQYIIYENYLNDHKTPKDPSDTKHTIKPLLQKQ